MVQPILQYGVLAWGGTFITHLNYISITQKSILKVMHSLNRRTPSKDVFEIAKVFNIRQLFVKVLLLHYHKYPSLVSNPRLPQYSTRLVSEGIIVNPRPRLVLTTHSPSYILFMLHRNLSNNLRSPAQFSRPAFKKLILSWIIQQEDIENKICSNYI